MTNLVSLDMFGHIDDVLTSGEAIRMAKAQSDSVSYVGSDAIQCNTDGDFDCSNHIAGEYVNGKWVPGTVTNTPHSVNVQPLNRKQIESLQIGAERINDYRQVWVNDGVLAEISEADDWTLPNVQGVFKTTQLDNRPTRNYCKFIAVRRDQ